MPVFAMAHLSGTGRLQLPLLPEAVERVTLYRYVGPKGELRDYGKRVLGLAYGRYASG
jgi:hypothetical protein